MEKVAILISVFLIFIIIVFTLGRKSRKKREELTINKCTEYDVTETINLMNINKDEITEELNYECNEKKFVIESSIVIVHSNKIIQY